MYISKAPTHAIVSKGIVLFLLKIIEEFFRKFPGVYKLVDTSAHPK